MLRLEVSAYNKGVETNYSLFCPESVKEITLRDFVDYSLVMQDAPEKLKELSKLQDPELQQIEYAKWSQIDLHNYYVFIAKCLSCLCKVQQGKVKQRANLEQILNLKIGSPEAVDTESYDSLFALFKLVSGIINSYEPKERQYFEHKGKRFAVPTKFIDDYGRSRYAPNMTTIEALEALQVEHVFSAKGEDGELVYKDRYYHTDLGVMAAICRECDKGGTVIDALPLDMHERESFLARRIKFFSDVTMDIALDVDFFLLNSKRILLHTQQQAQRLKTLALLKAIKRSSEK